MTDDTPTESRALVGIKVMATKLTTSDSADRVDEIGPIKIFKPVLVQVVGVGATVEVVSRRILPTFFVMCILRSSSVHVLGRT